MKNYNDSKGNRTRNPPACSAVPQPTAPPRAPLNYTYCSEVQSGAVTCYIQLWQTCLNIKAQRYIISDGESKTSFICSTLATCFGCGALGMFKQESLDVDRQLPCTATYRTGSRMGRKITDKFDAVCTVHHIAMCRWPTRCTILINNFLFHSFFLLYMFRTNYSLFIRSTA